MELKQYLKIIAKGWKVAVPAALLTLAITTIFVAQQPWVYETSATFVVRPRLIDDADAVKAIDTLIRGAEINTTFAGIAKSKAVQDRAAARLDESELKRADISLTSDVVAGTNILRITIRGLDPGVVHQYATAAAAETISYIDSLKDVFALAQLDAPTLPNTPSAPNKPLTVALGGILGIMLGGVAAFVAEYLREPELGSRTFNIVDPDTNAYNDEFFKLRFEQELTRSRRSGRVFTLAMIKITSGKGPSGIPPDVATMRHVGGLLEPKLRTEDIMAHVGDGTFAIILPDLNELAVEQLLARWSAELWPASTATTPENTPFSVSVGIGQYGDGESASDRTATLKAL